MAYGVNAPFGLRPLQSISGGSWTEKVNEYFIYTSADGDVTYDVSIFEGDPVVCSPVGNRSTTIARYLPNFADATPSTFSTLPILGVFVSCQYFDVSNKLIQSPFWPGATRVYPNSYIKAYVLDDPDVVFDIQVSTSIAANGDAFVASPTFPNVNTNVGLNGGFGSNFALNIGGGGNFQTVNPTYANNPTGGSLQTGQSAFYLDVSSSTANGAPGNDHDYNKTLATLPLKVIGYSPNSQNRPAPGLTLTTTPFLNVRVMINNHVYRVGNLGTTLTV